MQFYTIGYGGRTPSDFVRLLREHDVRHIVDVRLQPERASMGSYVKAKTADKGIERLLGEAGIRYTHVPELGNPFKDEADWKGRYATLMTEEGENRTAAVRAFSEPFCLLCAEKRVADCHRLQIADYLQSHWGWIPFHIE